MITYFLSLLTDMCIGFLNKYPVEIFPVASFNCVLASISHVCSEI